MTNEFNAKVAIVTGAGSGIGRATALAFAKEGVKVVVADVHSNEGEETVELIQKADGQAMFIKTDVSKSTEVSTLVSKTVETYGPLDFAFNNAGKAGAVVFTAEQTEETWDAIIDTNLKGVWLCMKYELLHMLKQGSGVIVNNSSIYGLVGGANCSVYAASKHGILGLTKCAAVEYAKSGVRINAVAPGLIETAMIAGAFGSIDAAKEQLLPKLPIGRIGKPKEIAEAVLWLCSDKASFVTGHTLTVDGGYVVQ